MGRDFDILIGRDAEGHYVASVPMPPGCSTQARSLGELSERIQRAIALSLEVEGRPNDPRHQGVLGP